MDAQVPGRYYLSYSTGDTHLLCYATADNPYGPFTYQGQILRPVVGWTTHHSVCEYEGRWYLFYHDSLLSGGVTHLRSIKATELHHDAQGPDHADRSLWRLSCWPKCRLVIRTRRSRPVRCCSLATVNCRSRSRRRPADASPRSAFAASSS